MWFHYWFSKIQGHKFDENKLLVRRLFIRNSIFALYLKGIATQICSRYPLHNLKHINYSKQPFLLKKKCKYDKRSRYHKNILLKCMCFLMCLHPF